MGYPSIWLSPQFAIVNRESERIQYGFGMWGLSLRNRYQDVRTWCILNMQPMIITFAHTKGRLVIICAASSHQYPLRANADKLVIGLAVLGSTASPDRSRLGQTDTELPQCILELG